MPEIIEFGDVIVNQTAAESILLYNRGTFMASNAMTLLGDDQDHFGVDPAFSSLDAGDSQFVSVSFTPDIPDTFSATLMISSDAGEAVVELNGTGIGEPTALNEDTNLTPGEFLLHQNYPNPFNPVTTIRYSLPTADNVSIKVLDMLGREVTIIVNEYKNAGVHSIEFDGSRFSSGVYFYQLQAGDFSQARKMLLVK